MERRDGVAERLRTKRLQEYKIIYDKEARKRNRLLRRSERSDEFDSNALDEEIQANPLYMPSPLLYMDSYGNLGQRAPLISTLDSPNHWISMGMNRCIPLLLTVEGVWYSEIHLTDRSATKCTGDVCISILADKENFVPVSPPEKCIILCPSVEPSFVTALNFFMLRLRVFTKSTNKVIGYVTARPFASTNLGLCKTSTTMHIVEQYPIVFESEIVGSIKLQVERLTHDYTMDTVQHFKVDADERSMSYKNVRKLLDAKTQTVGYFKQTLEEIPL